METPHIGDSYSFTPAYAYEWTNPNEGNKRGGKNKITVTGRIVSFNHAHRHFTVAYEIDSVPQKETFKF